MDIREHINFWKIRNLIAWIFPYHEDRARFRRFCGYVQERLDNGIKDFSDDGIAENYRKVVQRIKGQSKIKVLFLVSDDTKWKAQSLYDLMAASERFEPYIALTVGCEVANGKDRTGRTIEQFDEYFKSHGMRTVRAYENGRFKDLKEFAPDMVFYQQHWGLVELQAPENVSEQALTFYIPYYVQNYLDLHLDTGFPFHRQLFKYYVINDTVRKLYEANSPLTNLVTAGHTQLDTVMRKAKESGETKYVIYAPHYSIDHEKNLNPVNYSTFDKYGEMLLEYAKQHPEIAWVFKPHPMLKIALQRIGYTDAQIAAYYDAWAKIGTCCVTADYVDLFAKSKALITDCGSFTIEYFCTGKPLIHLKNINCKGRILTYTERIFDTFYKVWNKDELYQALDEILIKGNDYKKVQREEVLKQSHLFEDKSAAERIMSDLMNYI